MAVERTPAVGLVASHRGVTSAAVRLPALTAPARQTRPSKLAGAIDVLTAQDVEAVNNDFALLLFIKNA